MSAGDDQRPVAITAAQGRRIASAVRAVEAGTPRPSGGRVVASNWNPGVVRAKVTTAIPTGTLTTPSTTGRAQIYHKDASGAWAASGSPVVVVNDHTLAASIAVNKVVKLAWIDGDWYLIAADC
jgi:hypothetical protein